MHFKGLLRAGTAEHFTMPELAAALVSTACMLCKKSNGKAALVSILHCRRACQSCVDQHQDFLPLKIGLAMEIFGLDNIDMERIPVARLDFNSTDEQLEQGRNRPRSPKCSMHKTQSNSVVSISSVAKVVAGKQEVSAKPTRWTKLCRESEQRHLNANYCYNGRHSSCSTSCLLPQEFDLE
jgi:hypothetical protein